MQKNTASQKVIFFAFDATTNLPKTGDAANITGYVSKDWGTVTVLGDTSATEMDATNAKGFYMFDLTQGETNANILHFSAKSSTANVVVIGSPATIQTVPGTGNIKKGVAFAKFAFLMTDSTNHAPATGKTVSVQISKDGGAFGALSSGDTVTEIGNGIYEVDLDATDTNANCIILRFTAGGCDDTLERIITEF